MLLENDTQAFSFVMHVPVHAQLYLAFVWSFLMENIGPSLASTFQSHIERLVSSPEESQQRAAAEVSFLLSSLLFVRNIFCGSARLLLYYIEAALVPYFLKENYLLAWTRYLGSDPVPDLGLSRVAK
jgi:hypothetical protein